MNKIWFVLLGLLIVPSISALCWDLDGGINPFMRGATYVGDETFGYGQYADFCHDGLLREFYCFNVTDTKPIWVDVSCPIGCKSVFYYNLTDIYSNATLPIESNLSFCRWTGGGSSVSHQIDSCNGFIAFNKCISYGDSCEESVCEPACESSNVACSIGCHNYCNKKCSQIGASLSCADSEYTFAVRG